MKTLVLANQKGGAGKSAVATLLVAIAFLVGFAAARLTRALRRNERYWFGTWRWGRVLAILMAVGLLLKLLLT